MAFVPGELQVYVASLVRIALMSKCDLVGASAGVYISGCRAPGTGFTKSRVRNVNLGMMKWTSNHCTSKWL